MRVFEPRITEQGDQIQVSARVEINSSSTEFPETLWFSFADRYRHQVTDHLNGFAVALVPLAMTLGENLQVEGVLSPRLLRGLEEYQRIQCTWEPTRFKPIEIEPDTVQPTNRNHTETGVGCTFSGGVDSAFTLWRHLPQNERNHRYRISHCLMINGFDCDSDLDNTGSFARIQQAYEPMMKRLGVDLVVCRTNYMAFSDPRILKHSFGAMVTSPALILERLFSCFFIASSYRFDDFLRDGSHLLLDHLIATESMETVHDSSHLRRPEKTKVISQWSETYSTLRVCFNNTGFREETQSIENCGICEKCIRTMATLDLCGALDRYTVFPKALRHLDTWRCYYGTKGSRAHPQEVISEAWKLRRFDVLIDFSLAVVISMVIRVPRELIRRVHLHLEERSETYATLIRRLLPRLRRRARWIR